MRSSFRVTALVPLLLSLAACGGTAAPSTTSSMPVEIAQSSVRRVSATAVAPADLAAAVAANNAFAMDLYAKVRAIAAPGNLLTSPLSASLALTMTYAGAIGTTATQMAAALHIAGTASTFAGQNALSQALASRASEALAADAQTAAENQQPAPSPGDYDLDVVNSVWGEKTYPWEPPFLDILAKNYGTGVYLEDFRNAWDPAREAINAWVSGKTADKIENLLPPGSLDDMTRMVLVNAIHLKLPWTTAFDPSLTRPDTFTKADAGTVSADFMHATETLPYVDDGQAQIVRLPLADKQLEVVVALPHGDLATYEAGFATGASPLAAASAPATVTLALPKVSFTSPTFSLRKALEAMGMTQAFDSSTANFTGLCAHLPDGGRLYILDVLQKAMLAMQETGVEAAAATAVIINRELAAEIPPPPVSMVVNRPFVIAIVDATTGAVLFLGHIDDPTEAGGP